MPLNEDYYRDKRTRSGRTGKAMRDRAQSRVESGEVAYDWRTAPESARRETENRLRVFEGQVPEDPLDQVRFIEAEQQERTSKAEKLAQPGPTKARAEITDSHGPHPQSASQGDTGDESGSQGLSTEERGQFKGGDPERGMKASAQAEQSMEAKQAMDEPDEEPMIRVGDLNGFFDSGIRLPENAPQWLREGFERMQEPADFMYRRMPMQAMGGMIEGFQNAAHSLDLAHLALKRSISGLNEMEQAYYDTINSPEYDPVSQSPFGVVVERPGNVSGTLVRTMGQFLPLFMGGISFMKGIGLGGGGVAGAVGRDIAAGAAADYAVFNAMEGNLHTMMRELGIENEWTAFMDASEADTHMGGKLKNMIEGGLLASGVELGFRGGKAFVRGGKMTTDQARNMADALVRASRATREMRELKWKAMEEEGQVELQQAGRERLSTMSANPTPSFHEMRGLTKVALGKIMRGATSMERFIDEWGKKHGYGVAGAQEAWDTAEYLADQGRGRRWPFYSRLNNEALKLQPKGTPAQYRKALQNNQNLSRDQLVFSGLDDYLEEAERLGDEINRADIMRFIDRNDVKFDIHTFERRQGKEGEEIVADEDPLRIMEVEPEPVQTRAELPEGAQSDNPVFEHYIRQQKDHQKTRVLLDRRQALFEQSKDEVNKRLGEQVGVTDYAPPPTNRAIPTEVMDELMLTFSDVVRGSKELPESMDRESYAVALERAARDGGDIGRVAERVQSGKSDELTERMADRFSYELSLYYRDAEQNRIMAESEGRLSDPQKELENFEANVREVHDPENFSMSVREVPETDGVSIIELNRGTDRKFYPVSRQDRDSIVSDYEEGSFNYTFTMDDRLKGYNNLKEAKDAAYFIIRNDPKGTVDLPHPPKRPVYSGMTVNPDAGTYEELVYTWKGDPFERTVARRTERLQAEEEKLTSGESNKAGEAKALKEEGEKRAGPGAGGTRKTQEPAHFSEAGDDQIAHGRGTVEAMPTGRVQYHIEEVQSDWHQSGRLDDPAERAALMEEQEELSQRRDGLVKQLTQTEDEAFASLPMKESLNQIRREYGAIEEPGTVAEFVGIELRQSSFDDEALRRAADRVTSFSRELARDKEVTERSLDEMAVEFVSSYRQRVRESVLNLGRLPRPPVEVIKENTGFQGAIKGPLQRTWEVYADVAEKFPDLLTSGRRQDELNRKFLEMSDRAPLAPMRKNWHELPMRHMLYRAVNTHGADEITITRSNWQSFVSGTNEIAWQKSGNGWVVAVVGRHPPSPHMENEMPKVLLEQVKQEKDFGEVMNLKEGGVPLDEVTISRNASNSILRDAQASMFFVQSREGLNQAIDRLSNIIDEDQAETWMSRVWEKMQEAKNGVLEPLGSGRQVNYDKKYPSSMQKVMRQLADDEDKKAIVPEEGTRKWAEVDSIQYQGNGRYSVTVRTLADRRGEVHYTMDAPENTSKEKLREMAEEFTLMPVTRFKIPESVKRNVKGGVPLMQFAPAAPVAGMMAGEEDAAATQ